MTRTKLRTALRAALIASCLALGWLGAAQGNEFKNEIRIVTGDDGETTRQVVASLRRELPRAALIDNPGAIQAGKKRRIYVAVGPAALRTLIEQDPDGAIVSVFTSSKVYRSIVENFPKPRRAAVTAIYAEPSPSAQLQLISALYKRRIRVGVLLTEGNEYLLSILQNAASRAGLDLVVERVSDESDLNAALDRIAQVPVLLAIPDSTIYNAETIRNIFITTYRRNQPVIGFSAGLVKAGALASTYPTVDDVAAQLVELLRDFDSSGQLSAPDFARYFSVAINDNVARSLNLVVDETVRNLSRKPAEKSP